MFMTSRAAKFYMRRFKESLVITRKTQDINPFSRTPLFCFRIYVLLLN